ncbi:MAG: NADH-quinone oxidoreductase subunit NuoK [Thermodesulfobacteriota bacterium]
MIPLMPIPLHAYLLIAAFLFCAGLFAMLYRRSLIGILIGTELMLNGAGLNFMAFNKFLTPDPATGQILVLFVIGIAAAEAAIALSIILALFRRQRSVDIEQASELKR